MPSRRRVLAALGGASVALAGCSGAPETDPAETEDSTPSSTDTADPTPGPPETVTGSWTHDGADAGATYHVPVSPPEPDREVWSTTYPQSSVLLSDSLLFVGGDDLRVYDAGTGTRLSTRSFAGVVRPAAVANGTVFVTEYRESGPRTTHAVVPGGDVRWSREGLRVRRVHAGTGFGVLEDPETLVAFDPVDGSDRWRLPAAELEATVTRFDDVGVGPDRLFVAGHNSGSAVPLLALDRADGSVAWTGNAPNHGSAVTVGERVLSGGFHGTVRAWTRDGEHAWSVSTPPPVLDVAAADGRAFVSAQAAADDEPSVTVWSGGTRDWAHDTGRLVALAADVAFVDDGDRLLALDAASGDERWRRSFDDGVTGVLPVEEGLLVETAPADDERRLQLLV